jgi:hypothetical protein
MTEIDDTPREGADAQIDGWVRREDLSAIVGAHVQAHHRRTMRAWKALALTLVTGLLGVAGGVVKAHGDNRAAAERQLVRIEVIEKRLDDIKQDERERRAAELRIFYAPRSAAPSTPPAGSKEP